MWLSVETKGREHNMKLITDPAIYYLYLLHSSLETNQPHWRKGIKARTKYQDVNMKKGEKNYIHIY